MKTQEPPGPSSVWVFWLMLMQLPGLSFAWTLCNRLIRRIGLRFGWEPKTPLQRYGDVIKWRIIGFPHVSVLGPAEIRRVLEDNHLNYERHPVHRMFVPVMGTGLLTTFGDAWKRRRRMLQPAFLRTRMAGLTNLMMEEITSTTEGWAAMDSIALDVVQATRELTLRITARAMFPGSARADFGAFHPALSLLSDETARRIMPWPRLPDWVPTPHNRRLREAITVLRNTTRELILSGSAGDDEDPTVLGILLSAAKSSNGTPLSDEELVDEALTMLLAGHDTTASLLAWTLIELASHPEIQERLAASLAGASSPGPYLRQVLDESMRLHSPVPVFVRRAVSEDVLGGWRIRPGETILLIPGMTHHHPEYWPDPTRFDPDRFEPAKVQARPRYAFFPFGGGAHRCIGEHFALLEAMLVVEQIVRRFRLARQDTNPVRARGAVSLQPVGPVPIELTCR